MIYTYSQYLDFLLHAKQFGSIIPMRSTTYSPGEIVMRHDVDLDIEPLVKMAEQEENAGVRSTFFILTSCHSYNPRSNYNAGILKNLADGGWEIGLHYDPSIYRTEDNVLLDEKMRLECRILEDITGQKVESISIHIPSLHGEYPFFDGFFNAYDERIFNDFVYMSDSRMNFRGKNPYEFVKRAVEKPLQVLLHPLHFTEDGIGYPDIHAEYIKRHIAHIDEEHTKVNSGYAASKNTGLYDYMMRSE
ncbi:MAG: hypothetical protein CL946_02110 [Ectothiorhodospiraceae bacterium]|nr:hypothetical protein [Ectothiorhodospiraceae bacterium]